MILTFPIKNINKVLLILWTGRHPLSLEQASGEGPGRDCGGRRQQSPEPPPAAPVNVSLLGFAAPADVPVDRQEFRERRESRAHGKCAPERDSLA